MAVAEFERRGSSSERGLTQTFAEIFREFAALLQTEMQLMRRELTEKIAGAAIGLGMILASCVFLAASLILLLQAAIAVLIAYEFTPAFATLIVAGSSLLLGGILMWLGVSKLQVRNLAPTKTIKQLENDVSLIKL
jgi:hypothetical protein